jgi:hypothetical protein
MTNSSFDSSLPVTDGARPAVPVFDCHVLLLPPAGTRSTYQGRISNLPQITVVAGSERDCLRKIVDQFKALISKHLSAGEAIPWQVPPETRGPDEQERWIPVHL